jgi:hypothetical protein
MNNNVNLLEIFYLTDEFCKESDKTTKGYRLPSESSKKQRNKPSPCQSQVCSNDVPMMFQ